MARKATVLNQNQSWNLSLEGAWNSTTVNGITENRTFNQVYEILTSNSSPLTHDRKGNLTQNKDSSQYTWDYNNQLSHAVNASSENASYTYDALGRRISKQVSGITMVYVNVGYQIATEYQSTDGINFTEKQSYVYATYIDDPLVLIKANGDKFYYHSNGQFSVSKITDAYQNTIEAYAYNAYGDVQILQSYASLDNPYYFTGRQLDQETGLFYFRARDYDAKLGQLISRDPVGYVDGFSLYRGYFAVNGVDLDGLIELASVNVNGNNITVKIKFIVEDTTKSTDIGFQKDLTSYINRMQQSIDEVLSFTTKSGRTLKIESEFSIADPGSKTPNDSNVVKILSDKNFGAITDNNSNTKQRVDKIGGNTIYVKKRLLKVNNIVIVRKQTNKCQHMKQPI